MSGDIGSFGTLLREYRTAAGLTQEELAERARMSRAAIAKLELGRRQRPYPATIALLAGALSLPSSARLDLERAARRNTTTMLETAEGFKPHNNLPIQFSTFVGRDLDVAKVCKLLATHRLVTLVGTGGVGKTRLAVHAGEHILAADETGHHHDGIWFSDLSVVSDGAKAVAAIGASVGMEQCRTLDMLVRYLRAQRFLLIIDNCEHLLDAVAGIISEVLHGCPDGQILATSRQPLRVDGERVYRVPTLSVPAVDADANLSLSEALEFPAIRLFVDRAEAADSSFELKESMIPAVADICRRLDGIALAIELAAARTSAFSPATLAERLEDHFLLFTGGPHGSLSRHKTMSAVFDWSYGLLDEIERFVFRRLSIFVGGFTLELATSLLAGEIAEPVIVDVLASLVDKSLVQRTTNAEPPRYKMLEPARQYARERLRGHGEENAAARAHVNALLALCERFDATLKLTSDAQWAAYLEPERDNFRAVFEWSLGPDGDAALAQRLGGSRTATQSGFASGEVRNWISAILKTCSASTPAEVRAKLALTAANSANYFVQGDEAVAMARDALDLQPADNLPGRSAAQYCLGAALFNIARLTDADAVLREAMMTARKSGAETEYVFACIMLANVRHGVRDEDEARKLATEALQRTRAAGADRLGVNALVTLAEIEFASGNVENAVCLGKEALQSSETRVARSTALSNLSAYLVALAQYEEARQYAHETLRYSRILGVTRSFAWAIQHLAAIAVLRNHGNEDDTLFRRAASLLGFVNATIRRTGRWRHYTEQQEHDKIISALRDAIEENALEALMEDGKAWSEDRAILEALAI